MVILIYGVSVLAFHSKGLALSISTTLGNLTSHISSIFGLPNLVFSVLIAPGIAVDPIRSTILAITPLPADPVAGAVALSEVCLSPQGRIQRGLIGLVGSRPSNWNAHGKSGANGRAR